MLRFAVPDYLYLLAAIPLLTAVYLLAVRSRRRRLERFGNPQTLAELMPEASPTRMRNKAVFFLTALALLAVAMARPQLGSKLREVEREGVEIMIAVDVSNSMLARDFEPNRLERTKYAVEKVLEGLEEDKVGVIVFAGDAYVQLPITSIGLQEVIARINETEKAHLSEMVFEEYDERYQYLLVAVLFLLLAEFALLPRRNRLLARYNIFGRKDSGTNR